MGNIGGVAEAVVEALNQACPALKQVNIKGLLKNLQEDIDNPVPQEWSFLVSKTLHVDKNRIDTYTPNGSILFPFKEIQSAIDATSSSTLIIITQGTYTENLILKPGLQLRSQFNSSYYTVYINGKVTYSIGGGSVRMSGIQVHNTGDHAIEFSGAVAQKFFAHNCKFETNSVGAHHAFVATNTHANSEVRLYNSLVKILNSSGGAKCIHTDAASANSIGMKNTTIKVADDEDNLAVDLKGSVVFWHGLDDIHGRVEVADTASCTLSLATLYSITLPCLTTNSAGITTMASVGLSTGASPVVDGAGAFAYCHVAYYATGKGFAGTLNGGGGADLGAIQIESAKNLVYVANPANWVGPVPGSIQDAIARIATAVVALGGPIA